MERLKQVGWRQPPTGKVSKMDPNTARILLKAYLRKPLCNMNSTEKLALEQTIAESEELKAYKQVSQS